MDLGIIAGIIPLAGRNTAKRLEKSNHCSTGSEGQRFLLSLLCRKQFKLLRSDCDFNKVRSLSAVALQLRQVNELLRDVSWG